MEYAHATDTSSDQVSYQVFRYVFDSQGRISAEKMFSADSLQNGAKPICQQHHIYEFDSTGRCIKEQTIDGDGESDGPTVYQYDGQGNVTRETTFNSAGEVRSITNREYGSKHSLLFERANENRSGQSSTLDYRWSREHRYDAQENETDLFSYEQGILEAHRVWTYDYRGRLISSQVIVSDPAKDQQVYGLCADCGLSSGRSVYKYDKNSRIREERVFQAGDRLVSLNRYSYDSHGNRTREWVYQFGSPESGQRKTVLKLDGVRRVATSTNGLPKSAFSYDSHGNWIASVHPTDQLARCKRANHSSDASVNPLLLKGAANQAS